jgi:hypothetical protein
MSIDSTEVRKQTLSVDPPDFPKVALHALLWHSMLQANIDRLWLGPCE